MQYSQETDCAYSITMVPGTHTGQTDHDTSRLVIWWWCDVVWWCYVSVDMMSSGDVMVTW